MNFALQLLLVLLFLYQMALVYRLVVQLVITVSRTWRPRSFGAVATELIYTITDPPMKALRRVIPVGAAKGVGFDFSVIVLFVLLYFATVIVQQAVIATL